MVHQCASINLIFSYLSVQHIVFLILVDKLLVFLLPLEQIRLVGVRIFRKVEAKRFAQLRRSSRCRRRRSDGLEGQGSAAQERHARKLQHGGKKRVYGANVWLGRGRNGL